jgi:hypothetical protein
MHDFNNIKSTILANGDKDVIYFLFGGSTTDPSELKDALDIQENIAAVKKNGLVFSFDPKFNENLTRTFGVNSLLYRRKSVVPEEELLSIFCDEKIYKELFANKKVIIIDGISTNQLLQITPEIVAPNAEKPNFNAFSWVVGFKFHHLDSHSVYFPQDPRRCGLSFPLYNLFTNSGAHLEIGDIATWDTLSFISRINGSAPLSTQTISEVAATQVRRVQEFKEASHRLFSSSVDSKTVTDTAMTDGVAILAKKL